MHTNGLLSGFSALLVTVSAAPIRRHSAPAALLESLPAQPSTSLLHSLSAITAGRTVPAWTLPSWTTFKAAQSATDIDEQTRPSSIATSSSADLPITPPKALDSITKLFAHRKDDSETRRTAARSALRSRTVSKRTNAFTGLAGPQEATLLNAPPLNPNKETAFAVGMGNFKQHVAASVAAVQANGNAGLDAMWAQQIPNGNAFGRYYSSRNGNGNPEKAKINKKNDPNPPANDVTNAVLSMMAQIEQGPAPSASTTGLAAPGTAAPAAASTKKTKASS